MQTLADLGLVGLLLALALLGDLDGRRRARDAPVQPPLARLGGTARRRAAGLAGAAARRGRRYSPERIGLLTMLCLVVVFGIHSPLDWTWYVPGNACVALLCAGWLAGRGPLRAAAPAAATSGDGRCATAARRAEQGRSASAIGRPSATRIAIAAAVLVGGLLVAWAQWQPQRSEDAREAALAQLASNPRAATASAESAVSRDPLSAEALFALADVQQATGHPALARATLQHAVRLQPSNPQTWLALGRFDLRADPARRACTSCAPAST